jgi:hypothetical protein
MFDDICDVKHAKKLLFSIKVEIKISTFIAKSCCSATIGVVNVNTWCNASCQDSGQQVFASARLIKKIGRFDMKAQKMVSGLLVNISLVGMFFTLGVAAAITSVAMLWPALSQLAERIFQV